MDKTSWAAGDREEIIPTDVSQCLNPECLQLNLGNLQVCHNCGESLLLAGRYRSLNYIDAGGFAYTFEAVDEHRLQTPCVIKQFVSRQLSKATIQQAIDLFRQEAAILKNLGNHPQIPSLLAFLTQKERLYLVQEFISGQNLLQRLDRTGNFSQEQVKQILIDLLPVLEFIHQRQIIHRDIKPSNIISQDNGSLVLIDFGSSLQSSQEFLTQIGSVTGTLGYAAPEQIKGEAIPASDLFSLGATALHLLTGILPPEAGINLSTTSLDSICRQAGIIPNPQLSKIITKLLQPEIANRYHSATEVIRDLARIPLINEPDRQKNEQPQSLSPSKANIQTLILNSTQENADLSNQQLDYQQLEQLLAVQNYLEAEGTTWQLLLQISRRQAQGCLTLKNIIELPLQELKTIDRLWQHYSNNHFGLNVQREIYQDWQAKNSFDYDHWQKFAECVGWYKQGKWLKYSELTFNLQADKGHLPVCCIDIFNRQNLNRGVCSWWRLGFITLTKKLEQI